jgi:hypothetical protein
MSVIDCSVAQSVACAFCIVSALRIIRSEITHGRRCAEAARVHEARSIARHVGIASHCSRRHDVIA